MNKEKKIFISAAEPSGDLIGAKLIEDLQSISPDILIRVIAGENIEKLGFKSLFNIKETSIIGIIEVLPKIFKILKLINNAIKFLIEYQPDVIVTIDSPGLHNVLVKKIRKLIKKNPKLFNKNLKIIHYVAPSVWAWRKNRAKKLAQIYDALFVLFPFEPQYFEKHGLSTYFVSHMLFLNRNFFEDEESEVVDAADVEVEVVNKKNAVGKAGKNLDKNEIKIDEFICKNGENFFKKEAGICDNLGGVEILSDEKLYLETSKKIEKFYRRRIKNVKIYQDEVDICLLPGSRESEIRTLLPIFFQVLIKLRKNFQRINAYIPTINSRIELVEGYCDDFFGNKMRESLLYENDGKFLNKNNKNVKKIKKEDAFGNKFINYQNFDYCNLGCQDLNNSDFRNFCNDGCNQSDFDKFSLSITTGDKIRILKKCNIGLISSGTVTLEAAKCMLPSVVVYKISKITAFIVKLLVKIKCSCLINIINDKKIIPEFLQEDCNPDMIFDEIIKILRSCQLQIEQIDACRYVIEELRPRDDKIVAKILLNLLNTCDIDK